MSEKKHLAALGHDVLVNGVFPYLSEEDIQAVGATCRVLREYTSDPAVWHDQFFKTFGLQPNPFTMYKWPEMYRWRRMAGLYTWGSSGSGRLGFTLSDIGDEYRTQAGENGIIKPKKVDQLGSLVLSDVVAGGYGFTVLTGDGRLYGIGELQEYYWGGDGGQNVVALPLHRPRNPFLRIGGVIPRDVHQFQQPQTDPPPAPEGAEQREVRTNEEPQIDVDRVRQEYNSDAVPPLTPIGSLSPPLSLRERCRVKQLHTLSKDAIEFVSVSSGRKHILALDSKNKAWVWDRTYVYPGTQLEFDVDAPIRKLVAGWELSTAWLEGVGVIVWHGVGTLQHSGYTNSEPVKVNSYVVVPGTQGVEIHDMMAGSNFLVYITKDKVPYVVEVVDQEPKPPMRLDAFEKALRDGAQFAKIVGSYTRFALFSDKDDVLIGRRGEFDKPIIYDELQKVGCISIAVADHHNLALLRGGQMLTWGCESKACGAFGLGRRDDVLKLGATQTSAGLNLDKPVPVDLPGRHVLAIAAAGWQSAAIMTEANIDSQV
ncbi:hypothetical protein TRVA0_017S01530 [Trichomonascus vanleenenianus]|uniref:SCF ubiquitin ligase complex subunit SAF1 n=1 Tax=Trichomonascus vanleenenianus TaxID=2268995 RepID=UPI003ECA3F42